VAKDSSKKSIQLLSLLIADFCNKIGTKRPIGDVRIRAAIRGITDIRRLIRVLRFMSTRLLTRIMELLVPLSIPKFAR
jgi:hypothetical protein